MKTLKNKRILIVEDDPVSSEFLHEVLADKVLELIFTDSGEESVNICKKDQGIDLVLMDIRLPGISGYDAINKIKSIRNDLPLIAQTAYALEKDKEKIMVSGCDDYISKPIDIKELLEKITRLI